MRLALAALIVANIAFGLLIPALYEGDDSRAFRVWAAAEERLVATGQLTVAPGPDGEDRSPGTWWLQRQLAPGLLGKGHATRSLAGLFLLAQTAVLVVLAIRRPRPAAIGQRSPSVSA